MGEVTERDWERVLMRLQEYVATAREQLQTGASVQAELTLGELEEELQNELRDLHNDLEADEGEEEDVPTRDPDDDISPLDLGDA